MELQKVLGVIGGVIPSKSTLPILENFLFDLTKDKLSVTATDLDISMSFDLKVKGSVDGKIAIPAKRLTETVRSLPITDIQFIIDTASNKIIMTTSTGEYKLAGESSDNFPSLPSFKGIEEIKLDTESLRRMISKTSFAVSSDELRPAMMGILFQIGKSEMRSVATDGHRLVRLVNTELSSKQMEREVIVPAKALILAMKSFEGPESNISFSETHVMFSLGGVTLVSRMIEEKYPNYESVIPVDNEKKLTVEKNLLIASVRRAALYASSTTHQVRFSLKKGTLTVSAEDIDFGSEAKETISCDYSSEGMEIGFNSNYIVDILSHVDTDEVVMMLSSATRACIVKPTTQRKGENLLMLVMPVRLNS